MAMHAVMASMPTVINGVRFIAGWFIVKAGDALRIAERARVTPPPPQNRRNKFDLTNLKVRAARILISCFTKPPPRSR